MKNKRLLQIAEFIESTNRVADIGCDHGYLAIYLKQVKNCPLVIASDVNENALSVAKKNIEMVNLSCEISCVLSDGVNNIPIPPIDTLVIAGMGSHTILDILNHEKIQFVTNIILQSNNDFYLLRKVMQERGFFLQNEAYILEHGHNYFVMKYIKGKQSLTDLELRYGFFKDSHLSYYERCLKKNLQVLESLPKELSAYQDIKNEVMKLQRLIKQIK